MTPLSVVLIVAVFVLIYLAVKDEIRIKNESRRSHPRNNVVWIEQARRQRRARS